MGKSPGKFEGEPDYVDYLWDQSMEGADDQIDFPEGEPSYFGVKISPEDRQKFAPDLDDVFGVIMWESDQGFVYSEEYADSEEYEKAVKELEDQADDDFEESLGE